MRIANDLQNWRYVKDYKRTVDKDASAGDDENATVAQRKTAAMSLDWLDKDYGEVKPHDTLGKINMTGYDLLGVVRNWLKKNSEAHSICEAILINEEMIEADGEMAERTVETRENGDGSVVCLSNLPRYNKHTFRVHRNEENPSRHAGKAILKYGEHRDCLVPVTNVTTDELLNSCKYWAVEGNLGDLRKYIGPAKVFWSHVQGEPWLNGDPSLVEEESEKKKKKGIREDDDGEGHHRSSSSEEDTDSERSSDEDGEQKKHSEDRRASIGGDSIDQEQQKEDKKEKPGKGGSTTWLMREVFDRKGKFSPQQKE
jgi:hypothetical protein